VAKRSAKALRGPTRHPPEDPVGATGRVGETAMCEIVVVVLVHGEFGVEVEVLAGQRGVRKAYEKGGVEELPAQ
jgi:hypothetical protein